MKKIMTMFVAVLMMLSFGAFAEIKFEVKELPSDRNGMEYASAINALDSKISGFKWAGPDNLGYVFTMKVNENRTSGSDQILFDVQKYVYTQVLSDDLFMARQSERVGYVELVKLEDASTKMHLKLIDDNTLEFYKRFDDSREVERIVLKKVNQFAEKPAGSPRLKSAKERGTWF